MKERVVIIGAGPYGLASGAFLKRAGFDIQLYGDVMGFWEAMPRGMFLRSYFRASNIADPDGAYGLEQYEASIGRTLARPIPLADFIEYGHWFRDQTGIPVDSRRVTKLMHNGAGFELRLDDGATVEADRVVVATGITPFPWSPPMFEGFDLALVSHTSSHYEYSGFDGKRVLVVGAGQSALESAAFLNEAGAVTELLARRSELRYLRGEKMYETKGRVGNVLYPAWGVGPPGVNWLMGRPSIFRLLPARLSAPLARRAIRPAGASWLRPRLTGVRITTGTTITTCEQAGSELRLQLDDGSSRVVDHVLLGTGYRIDVSRYEFLDSGLLQRIRLKQGYPRLSASFESTVPRLHFVGAPAALSAGPGMRFVSHTDFTAKLLTAGVLGNR